MTDAMSVSSCHDCPMQSQLTCRHPDAPPSSTVLYNSDYSDNDFQSHPPDWCPLHAKPITLTLTVTP